MTIEKCYSILGGNFEKVCSRIPSTSLIEKFVKKFLEDDSFDMLCREMEAGNRPEAFRAAHTLKGVCANLNFDRLHDSASRLTEILRKEADEIPSEAAPLMEEVRQDYLNTVSAIRTYLGNA